MKRHTNEEEHRQARLDDLRKRRDRVLVHPILGPRFRAWEAARKAKASSEPVDDQPTTPIDRMMSEVESVMAASGRQLLDKLFVKDRVLVVKYRAAEDDVEFIDVDTITYDCRNN
jgi:hypothetical protein